MLTFDLWLQRAGSRFKICPQTKQMSLWGRSRQQQACVCAKESGKQSRIIQYPRHSFTTPTIATLTEADFFLGGGAFVLQFLLPCLRPARFDFLGRSPPEQSLTGSELNLVLRPAPTLIQTEWAAHASDSLFCSGLRGPWMVKHLRYLGICFVTVALFTFLPFQLRMKQRPVPPHT